MVRSENVAIAFLGSLTLLSASILAQPDIFWRIAAQWHISEVMQVGAVLEILLQGGIIAIVVGVALYLLPPTKPMGVRILYGGISAIIAYILIVVALGTLGAFAIADPYEIPMTMLNLMGAHPASAQVVGLLLIMITLMPAVGLGVLVATFTKRIFSIISYAILAFFFILDVLIFGLDLGILIWALLTPAYFLGGLFVSAQHRDINLLEL